jgi:hypothetical protein
MATIIITHAATVVGLSMRSGSLFCLGSLSNSSLMIVIVGWSLGITRLSKGKLSSAFSFVDQCRISVLIATSEVATVEVALWLLALDCNLKTENF